MLEQLLIPIGLGLALSVLAEQCLQPRPAFRRPQGAWLVHVGTILILIAFELTLFRRPWNAVANALALQFFVVLVSNAKHHALREPFLFQDFEYFTDTLRHPRLYLPFFGWWRALFSLLAVVGAVYSGLLLETPIWPSLFEIQAGGVIVGLVVAGMVTIAVGLPSLPPPKFVPEADLRSVGLIAYLWQYALAEIRQISDPPIAAVFAQAQDAPQKPIDIVIIQSESFFDARSLPCNIRPPILATFDQLSDQACLAGTLDVPAWGANTVRSEFGFLSGLQPALLGVHQFNPYRKFAGTAPTTLASHFRALGYRTVCIHPYPGDFYRRDTILPKLGFDEFIDITQFGDAPRCGPYISDQAVAEKIASLRDAADKPLFIFAITMENHGPLHWERVNPGEIEHFYESPPPAGWEDLTIYLRHLANADAMLTQLHQNALALQVSRNRETVLCFYGDHVPIMPKVYADLHLVPQNSNFLLWRSDQLKTATPRTQNRIEDLAGELLKITTA